MKTKLLFIIISSLLISSRTFAQTIFSWAGEVSSEWNNPLNWDPAAVPGTNATLNFNNDAVPFFCVLDQNRNINILNCTVGILDLNNYDLTVNTCNLNGGLIRNGQIIASNFSQISSMNLRDLVLLKTGNINNDWDGGNILHNVTISNQSNRRIRMGELHGDSFTGTTVFNKNNTGEFHIARNGNNIFNGNVYINSNINGNVVFGADSGTTTIQSGFALLTDGFSNGSLTINNLTQLGNAANGSFFPINFICSNSTFGGSFSSTANVTIRFTNCNFREENYFSANNIYLDESNSFSTHAGTTTFDKNGNSTNDWFGGNSFGNLILNNNSSSRVRLAFQQGDIFLGSTTFNKNGTGNIEVAFTGSNTFNGNVKINNTSVGSIIFGGSEGISTIQDGFALLTDTFNNGVLNLNQVNQLGNTSNSNFSVISSTISQSTFGGNIAISATGNLTINSSEFNRNNSFEGANLYINQANKFSNIDGTTTFTKIGNNNDNDWTGGNTFGNLVINNNSTRRLRLAFTEGDTILGTAVFNKNNIGNLMIARSGTNLFGGDITINNLANIGTLSFGDGGGTSLMSTGAALLTTDFNGGILTLNHLTQVGNVVNGIFNPNTFNALNSHFDGAFSVSATGTVTLNACSFKQNNEFSGSQVFLQNENNLSSDGGTTTLTFNGENMNCDWNGGNTFGNLIINTSSNRRLIMGLNQGDTFLGNLTVNRNTNAELRIAYRGSNLFNGNVTINSTALGLISFGDAGGVSTMASGSALLSNGLENATFNINNFTQLGEAANGSFIPASFSAVNSKFGGNFTVVTSGNITLNTCDFEGENIFTGLNILLSNSNKLSPLSAKTTITKTGGTADIWTGGNVFGNLEINNNSELLIRMANSIGDTFNGTTIFNKNNTGEFNIAYRGDNFFSGNIFVNNQNTGTVGFGQVNGASILSAGYALLTNGFNNAGSLVIRQFTQEGATSNSAFNVLNFEAVNSNFGGNFSISASGNIVLNSSSFLRSNAFTGLNITLSNANNLSTAAGTTSITKTGGTNDTWTGGNTFGNIVINNNADTYIRLANSTGDTFTGTAEFNKNSTGDFNIAYQGTNTFAGNVTINTASSGLVNFGQVNGISSLASGVALLTNGFSNANLVLRQFSQAGSASNGSFNPLNFDIFNSNIGGNFTVNATGNITFNTVSFSRTSSFSALNITLINANQFSFVSGLTTFTKTGGTSDSWTGGNTFGNLIINNNSGVLIRLANTNGDTFNGSVTFNKNSTGDFSIAYRGVNLFYQNVTINNNTAGTMRFGELGGTSILSSGRALLTNGFTHGTLILNQFTQHGTATNGSFNPATFTASSCIVGGNFTATTTGTLTLSNSSFSATNNFTGSSVAINGANNFSLVSGATSITKTGAGDNDWAGNNNFGVVNITNQSGSRIRMANSLGDIFHGNATFLKSSTGDLQVAYNGNNFFRGNVTTTGSNSILRFGISNGVVHFDGAQNQTINGEAARKPEFRRLTLAKSTELILNVPVDISLNLNLNNGVLRSSATNLLTLFNGATANNFSDSSYVNGPMRKIGNQAFTFPTGDAGFLKTIAISAPGVNTHHFTAQYYHNNSNANFSHSQKDASLIDLSTCGYWTLDRTNGTSAVSVTLDHANAACDPYNPSTLKVARWNGTRWVDHGNGGFNSFNVISASAISSFSPFVVAYDVEEPLPVELLSFNATVDYSMVNLIWETLSESNSSHFVVQRSKDLLNFEQIGTVEAAGFSNSRKTYLFQDNKPYFGISYYRLIQADIDGTNTEVKPIAVELKTDGLSLKAFPNPFTEEINLKWSESLGPISIVITDISGKIIKTEHIDDSRTLTHRMQLNQLKAGIYFINFTSKNLNQTMKITKKN